MTERLYYTDAYRAEFEAAVAERADGGRRVYLDRTAFYPTSGGQPHDTGWLGDVAVVDVVDEGERVAHVLAAPLEAAGPVTGRIDWTRRFDHMQQHTGQHLLSAVFAELFGHDTVSVHFGRETSTLDLDGPPLDAERIAGAEERANVVVMDNRPVGVSFEDAASATGLRKPATRAGTLRIVTIHDLDRSACGGTHVRATGEIGPILIRKAEKVRQTTRVEFLCGLRAVRWARTGMQALAALTEQQRVDLKQAETARRALEAKLGVYRARELHAAAEPSADGVRRVVLREENASLESLRDIAQACATLPRAMFIGVAPSVPGVVIGASEDSGVDAAAALKGALAPIAGRGGGTARLAQGTVDATEKLEQVVRYLLGEDDR